MEKLANIKEIIKTDQDKRANEESRKDAVDKVKERAEKSNKSSSKSNRKLKGGKIIAKLKQADSISTGENDDEEDIEDDDLKYCPSEDEKGNLNVIEGWNEKVLAETNDKSNEDNADEAERNGEEDDELENAGMPIITNCVSITSLETSDLDKSETIDSKDESLSKVGSSSEIDDADEKKVEASDANSEIDNAINADVTNIATMKFSDSEENDKIKTEEKSEDETEKMEVDAEEQTSDNDTPTLAILDVRTVCDEDRLSESEEKAENEDTKDGSIVESSETQSDTSIKKTIDKDGDTEADAAEVVTPVVENCGGKAVAKNKSNAAKKLKASDACLAKRLQGKNCLVCDKVKSCKYQVLMLGITKYLCDDVCFNTFRSKARPPNKTGTEANNENRPVTRSITTPKDVCNVCRKEIKNGMGLLPGIGENKPLCSEECMKTYQADQGLKRACAQCGKHIQSRTKCLTWEAMEFCNELCLGNYQMFLGSHCAYCNKAVQQTYIGKYCVRFGVDIKQFCSNSCLEEFKSGLKVCSYCQKDISGGPDGFLAPVGDKGQFKEFCTQSCMEKFELMGSASSKPSFKKCSMCKNISSVNVEVNFEGKEHKLCSESCIAAFRYANKINTSICDTCHKFFDLDISKQMTIQFEGSSKRFCSKACMNVFVLYHRKVVPCSWCRVKKYNFDMIERVDSNNHVQLFCSLNCLSLFRVSLNATSSRRVQCDYCRQVKPAQFHLTMSDASIRNFCTLNCAMQFQGQFSSVAPVITAVTSATSESTTTSSAGSTKSTTVLTAGTPIISSVVSLAPATSTQSTNLPSSSQTPKTVFVMSTPGTGATSASNAAVTKSLVSKSVSSTQTSQPSVTQQVIIKPPETKTIKNKAITCRPVMLTKGVSCKPHPCHKSVQTDEIKQNPIFIPVPVPIYVPVPMRMYTTPTPVPLPFPIPIPVPIFIPTTKNSAHGIFKQIKEIQQKIPDNPFEADLILMAEMVAEDSSSKDKKSKPKAIKNEPANLDGSEGESFGTENAPAEVCQNPAAFGDDVLQMALRMAENVDLEVALSSSGTLSHNNQSTGENGGDECLGGGRQLRSVNKAKRATSRGRGRGRKRARTEDQSESAMPASPVLPSTLTSAYGLHTVLAPQAESNCVLKYSYGVNAWKHWVIQKNNQLEKATASHRKLKLFKTDLLQLSAEELCFSLCLFVKEVRKPNSEEYAPDSIYYLCLGIQQYLFENGRIDNIFSDAYYEKFTISLNEVLQRYELNLSHDASTGLFLSRIEEEILWESKQLGAHSPHVLLNTLMYFNTKYFLLKTVEDHLQLSFSHILKHWKKTPGGKAIVGSGGVGCRNVLLRYYPTSQGKETNRRKKDSAPAFEQVENVENPLRCPVKLYEFYLSKCPESIKSRTDIFYLYPERSCVPDSPVWYSTMPLGRESIAKMLQRIRMVREVGEAIMAAS